MNKRIQELALQATKLANTEYNKDFDRSFDMIVAEKFAELIVRECAMAADMAVEAGSSYPGDYVGQYMGYGEEVSIPKSLYRVYQVEADCFDYDKDQCLFESDDLAEAHSLAYTKWKLSLREKAYTVIQPYDESCRGHYGIKSYNYGE